MHRVDAGIFATNPALTSVAERVSLLFEGVAVDGYLKNADRPAAIRAGEAGLGFGFGRQPSHLASGR